MSLSDGVEGVFSPKNVVGRPAKVWTKRVMVQNITIVLKVAVWTTGSAVITLEASVRDYGVLGMEVDVRLSCHRRHPHQQRLWRPWREMTGRHHG